MLERGCCSVRDTELSAMEQRYRAVLEVALGAGGRGRRAVWGVAAGGAAVGGPVSGRWAGGVGGGR